MFSGCLLAPITWPRASHRKIPAPPIRIRSSAGRACRKTRSRILRRSALLLHHPALRRVYEHLALSHSRRAVQGHLGAPPRLMSVEGRRSLRFAPSAPATPPTLLHCTSDGGSNLLHRLESRLRSSTPIMTPNVGTPARACKSTSSSSPTPPPPEEEEHSVSVIRALRDFTAAQDFLPAGGAQIYL